MAIGRLPTELHLDILHLLGRRSLESMSLTSKYFNAITEKLLYADIVLMGSEPWKAERLILEFLARPQLATYVKSITLLPPRSDDRLVDWTQSERWETRLQNQRRICDSHEPSIRSIIDSNFPQFPSRVRSTWLETMTRGAPTSVYLAFILVLTENLQNLRCLNLTGDEKNTWIHFVLSNLRCESPHDVLQPRLQTYLEHITHRGNRMVDNNRTPRVSIALPHGMVTLRLEEIDISDLSFFMFEDCFSCKKSVEHPHRDIRLLRSMPPAWFPTLKSFSAVRAQMSSEDMIDRWQDSYFSKVETLSLREMDTSGWLYKDFACFSESLSSAMPMLKVLEITLKVEPAQFGEGYSFNPFDNMSCLKNLQSLVIDFGFLCDYLFLKDAESVMIIDLISQKIPSQLKSLKLTNFSSVILGRGVDEWKTHQGGGIIRRFMKKVPSCKSVGIETFKDLTSSKWLIIREVEMYCLQYDLQLEVVYVESYPPPQLDLW